MGQERITTTKKGSITSVQAIYVPADDLTDPAPATTFAHLDATTVLSRGIAELGIYPAARSSGFHLPYVGPQRYRREPLQRCPWCAENPARIQAHRRPCPQDPTFPLAALPSRRNFHWTRRKVGPIAETIKGFQSILHGEYDHL